MALPTFWLFWAIIASISLACYNSMFKLVGEASMFLFLTAANAVAFICYALILWFNQDGTTFSGFWNNKAILYGAITGLMIAIFEICCFFTLKYNPSGLSTGYAVIGIGSLLLTVLAGVLIFKEIISWQNMLGVGFALLSVWLLSYKAS